MTELPAGAYSHLVTGRLAAELDRLDRDLVQRISLDPGDAHELLARHIAAVAAHALRAVPGDGRQKLAAQVALANEIVERIAPGERAGLAESDTLLTAIATRAPAPERVTFPPHPGISLASSALLVNGRGQPRIGT
jgi:hypothetical protein